MSKKVLSFAPKKNTLDRTKSKERSKEEKRSKKTAIVFNPKSPRERLQKSQPNLFLGPPKRWPTNNEARRSKLLLKQGSNHPKASKIQKSEYPMGVTKAKRLSQVDRRRSITIRKKKENLQHSFLFIRNNWLNKIIQRGTERKPIHREYKRYIQLATKKFERYFSRGCKFSHQKETFFLFFIRNKFNWCLKFAKEGHSPNQRSCNRILQLVKMRWEKIIYKR